MPCPRLRGHEERLAPPTRKLVGYPYGRGRKRHGKHRRIAKLEWITGSSDWTRTDYYYDTAWRVVEQRRAEGLATSVTVGPNNDKEDVITLLYAQYVWGLRYIDAPILRDRDSTGNQSLDETLYYCNDANMNVTALVDTDGDVVERYEYSPYGELTVLNGAADADSGVSEWSPDADNTSDWDNQILYAGYRQDPETDLYHVRFRYLHPTLGTWITRDPLGQSKPGGGYQDGMSLYEYLQSQPLTSADPMGLRTMNMSPCSFNLVDLGQRSSRPVKNWLGETLGHEHGLGEGKVMFRKDVEQGSCPDGCWQVVLKECTVVFEYWWSTAEAKEHEIEHSRVFGDGIESFATSLRRALPICTRNKKKAKCMAKWLDYRLAEQMLWASWVNMAIDCIKHAERGIVDPPSCREAEKLSQKLWAADAKERRQARKCARMEE